jgi:hypothetical protein
MRLTFSRGHILSRRKLLRAGLAGTAVGLAGVVIAPTSLVAAQVEGASSPVGDVYQLQAAFTAPRRCRTSI